MTGVVALRKNCQKLAHCRRRYEEYLGSSTSYEIDSLRGIVDVQSNGRVSQAKNVFEAANMEHFGNAC